MSCKGLLEADFMFDCDNLPIAGNETTAIIVNQCDLDRTNIVYDATNKCLITGFQLLPGKVGYCLQGIKQLNSTAWELIKKETSFDKFKHTFNGFILQLDSVAKCQLQEMAKGGKFVLLVERKYKGANNAEAFEVYGIEQGLELNVSTFNSNENDGSAVIELSNVDGFEESRLPATLLIGDYAGTKTLFDNKFIQAPAP